MRVENIYGCQVYENGTVIGRKGKPQEYGRYVTVKWDNKHYRNISTPRLVYYAFNRDFDIDDANIIVCLKDKKKGARLDNLELKYKAELIQGSNSPSSKLEQWQVDEIIKEYREAIDMSKDSRSPSKRVSYRTLAKKYDVTHNTIAKIIRGETWKEQHKFKKEG